MFPGFNFFDYLIILSGTLLCLKRVAEMERYHDLRVVVLTTILSSFVILFFLGYGFTLGNPPLDDCNARCTLFRIGNVKISIREATKTPPH
jgi:hypothetical protein